MPKQYSPQKVLDFLRKTSLMSLAVSDKDNQPMSHMMLFAVDDDFTFYFATKKSSKKHQDLTENDQVGLSIWGDKKMLVQITGTANMVEKNETMSVVEKLADTATDIESFWPPVLQINNPDYVAYKIKPKTIRALDLTSDSISHTTTLFSDIGAQL